MSSKNLPEGKDASEWFRSDKPIVKEVEYNGKLWKFEVADIGFIENLQLLKSVAKERNGQITIDSDVYVVAAGMRYIKKAPWPVTPENIMRLKKEAGAAIWEIIPSISTAIFGPDIEEVEAKN